MSVCVCVCVCVCVFVRARSQKRRNLRIWHLHSLLVWWYWREWSINFLCIVIIFGINSNSPNIKIFSISLKRSIVRMQNFDTSLPVRLSNYMWSFIKFRQLVKSQEIIVIKKIIKKLPLTKDRDTSQKRRNLRIWDSHSLLVW